MEVAGGKGGNWNHCGTGCGFSCSKLVVFLLFIAVIYWVFCPHPC